MSEYQTLLKTAIVKGWRTPNNGNFSDQTWMTYWRQCIAYEENPAAGRPVAPHRTGK